MMGLTKRQQDLLEYLRTYARDNGGRSPSYDEMKAALNLASKSGVAGLVEALQDKGFIRKMYCRARAIELLGETLPGKTAEEVTEAVMRSLRRLNAEAKEMGRPARWDELWDAVYRGVAE